MREDEQEYVLPMAVVGIHHFISHYFNLVVEMYRFDCRRTTGSAKNAVPLRHPHECIIPPRMFAKSVTETFKKPYFVIASAHAFWRSLC